MNFSKRTGHSFHYDEALFLLCTWLAYPNRLEPLELLLGYNKSVISECVNWTLEFLDTKEVFLLVNFHP